MKLLLLLCLVNVLYGYKYDTYLEHRSFLKHLVVDNYKIAYLDVGEGTPILFIHGVPTSSWLYRKIIGHLQAQKKYRLIAPDLLGFGYSDKPQAEAEYTPAKQAKRILALMEHLNIKEWSQVCHDLGGIWTWEIIKAEPEKIKNLIVLNTIGYEQGFKPPVQIKPKSFLAKNIFRFLKNKKTAKTAMRNIIKGGVKNKKTVTKEALNGYLLPITEGGYFTYTTFLTSIPDIKSSLSNYNQALAQAKPRTLIIWGKKDSFLLDEKQVPLFVQHLEIPPERVFILEDAKHFIQEENPHEIADYINEFLEPL